ALRREGVIGERAVFELGVGPTPVEARCEAMWMTQREAEFLAEQPDVAGLARALRLDAADIVATPAPQVVSTGNQFLLVQLASVEALGRARPDFAAWAPVASVSDFGAAYCFVAGDGGAVRARLFVPSLPGEDPATGSAAGPLGAYLRRHRGLESLVIE